MHAHVAELDVHQSGVSRHLRILLDAGFVQMRPDEWTQRAVAGFTSQLTKVPAALAVRRKR